MKNMVKKAILFFLTLELSVSSCTTIINGSKQNINIQSLTSDSKIYVDDVEVGRDKISIRLKRAKNHNISIKKEGYQTKNIKLTKEIVAGNLISDPLLAYLLLGLTGYGAAGAVWILVDATTGSWYSFKQDTFIVELEKYQTVK
jgi:hypothetical protein